MVIVSQDCFTRLMKIHYTFQCILFRILFFILYYNIVVISLKNIELRILFDPKIMARFQMKNTLKYIIRLQFL